MGMTEKDALMNALTLELVEDFGLNLKEVKSKIAFILQDYHITVSDERFKGENLETEYLMKKFSDGKKAIGMADATLKQYKIAIALLEKFANKKLADIESEDITNFLMIYNKTASNITVRCKYQLISSVYNYLFVHRYIPHNPMVIVDAPKATVIFKNPLSDLELERVKKACESLPKKESLRDMALIHFFVSTGCRVSEIKNLKISDVNFETKTCIVLGKGKKQRPVILTEKAIYRLNLYLESRKDKTETSPLFAHIRGNETFLTKDGIENIIKKIRKLADVEKLTCHSFRRYYATYLRKRNVNIQLVAKSLGHANLNQINRYSLYNNQEVTETIRNAM